MEHVFRSHFSDCFNRFPQRAVLRCLKNNCVAVGWKSRSLREGDRNGLTRKKLIEKIVVGSGTNSEIGFWLINMQLRDTKL